MASDYDLLMVTFRVRLKKARKPNQPRLRLYLKTLSGPDVAGWHFSSNDSWEIPPLIGMRDEDMEFNTMITTYIAAETDAASEIPGKERRKKNAMGRQRCSRPL